MLTVKKLSIAQASTYYSKDNYYTQQQGEYFGQLKNELGLGLQDLTHENFNQLLNGINPTTGEHLVHSKNKKNANIPAFDFTFSPSKSISIAYELALAKGDTKLLNIITKAHDNAVNQSLNHIEQTEIKARVQKNKKRVSQKTGNLLSAKFQHDINRNLDPQLHTHSVIFNFTKIDDNKYRSLDAQNFLKKKAPIIKNLGQYYRQSLKTELQKAGFKLRDIDKKESFYEIKEIDDDLIQTFSSRNIAIKQKVKELKKKFPNMSDSQLSMRAFFNTRVAKKGVNRDDVAIKNLETIDKITDSNQLLKKLNQLNPKQKNEEINHEEVFKIIQEVKKELDKKEYKSLKTPLNISVQSFKKLENQEVSLKDVYEHTEVQAELEPLMTMHDVVIDQLQKTKFSLNNIKKIDKNVTIDKLKQEEVLENAKFKRTNAAEITARLVKNFNRETRIAERPIARDEREFKDFNRAAATERLRARFRGAEPQRSNYDSNRNVGKNPGEYVKITREDLQKIDRERKANIKNQNQEISR